MPEPPNSHRSPTKSRALRGLLHVAIALHVAAIAIAPSTIPPSSQLQRSSFRAVQPYLEVLNLNHGYHYFAPDPGESRLLAYRTADGRSGRLPSKQIKPRLLYHRYFMLTESQPRAGDDASRAAAHYAALRAGASKFAGGDVVELDRVTHRLARPQFIRAGFRLGDPEQFVIEPVVQPAAIPLPAPEAE